MLSRSTQLQMFKYAKNTLAPDLGLHFSGSWLSRPLKVEPRRIEWKRKDIMILDPIIHVTVKESYLFRERQINSCFLKQQWHPLPVSIYFYRALISCKHKGTELGWTKTKACIDESSLKALSRMKIMKSWKSR